MRSSLSSTCDVSGSSDEYTGVVIVRAVGGLVAAALLASCGGVGGTAPPPREGPVAIPTSKVTTAISRGTPRQRQLIHSIIARMTPTTIYGVSIRPAGKHWFSSKPRSVIVRIAYRPFRQRGRGEWETALLGQAFATQSRRLGLRPVAAYQSPTQAVALVGPNPPKRDTRKAISGRVLRERVRAAAESSGADVIGLRVIKPLNFAFAITLRVDHPASYLAHSLEPFLRSLPSAADERYDGSYVRIVDRSGRFVWYQGGYSGDYVGGWSSDIRRDLRGCYSQPTYGTPRDQAEPPPCPED